MADTLKKLDDIAAYFESGGCFTFARHAREAIAEIQRHRAEIEGAIEAVAEAWASIDGKDDHFRHERDEKIPFTDPACTGHYEGYLEEARELIRRIERRGFTVRPLVE